jgi:hypothetical protein
MISGMFFWTAVVAMVVAMITGDKNQQGIYMPHAGYTWGAVMCVLLHIGLHA